MLAKMAENKKRSKGGRKKINESEIATSLLSLPTLEDIGLDKYQSSSYQKLAAIPDEQFEKDVAVASEIASEPINQ
jgi:hypothetical protein